MQNNIEMPFTRGGIVHLLILFTEKYAFLSGCGSQGEGIDLPWGRNKWKKSLWKQEVPAGTQATDYRLGRKGGPAGRAWVMNWERLFIVSSFVPSELQILSAITKPSENLLKDYGLTYHCGESEARECNPWGVDGKGLIAC